MATDASGPPCSVCGMRVPGTATAPGSVAGFFIHSSQDIPDPQAPGYWHEPDSAGRYRALIALCPWHEQELRVAGAEGNPRLLLGRQRAALLLPQPAEGAIPGDAGEGRCHRRLRGGCCERL